MRVYIAYKYRAVDNKNELIRDLEQVSGAIATLEHHPFVLGRDVQKWHASSGSVYKTIPHIFANIIKSDLVFAYVNSEAKSRGLPFEMYCAKILGKPVILAKKVGVSLTLWGIKPKQTIEFTSTQDLLDKIKTLSI
jgi:hypothetical protein